ncbi:disulfide bond formation protein B [Chelativorans sp. SCAU2101]|jgi:Disulfide bond formation protein DsbB|uniref:Disulfide bond formation protein B n=1 Tax=Chelativorans petroleitrophicus TaxID=2975484 RepID=A0A9X2X7S2_9HYPH|nr:disulfide bond formation protein B [Chelativorans petroleitrophicus]MCT8989701.1 disulfide bond formation protein B [Chelativorans petroleitrophicus]
MSRVLTAPTDRFHTLTGAFLAFAMAATVGTALGFQHLGGFIPCKLCLEQRVPYYIGVPVMILAAISAALRGPAILTRGLLLAGGILMLWGLGLGSYHAGVEWGWWEGPADCGAVAPSSGSGSLLDQLNAVVPPSCNEAAGRFLGLSFAGWNVVASAILAAIALRGAFKK